MTPLPQRIARKIEANLEALERSDEAIIILKRPPKGGDWKIRLKLEYEL